ncbi:sensor histidine kinase N-terminal domain-containing protein [Aquabacter sp. L1I39]|uniref:ATP-binding protein n=1 Tax=Aquabacter sp. L1I39 TaxID=2820278 RepID=UPI001ADC38EA|nr:ATP-binding protein [Aquabacter sp. L1I39]QTL01627.1 sensor histidine kinase N-terminal domain-containing protein [Aquabacter sp. L1I39]
MTSLRRRLFLVLFAATGLIWLCAVAWISITSRAELEHVLDARLQEAARMVHSLVAGGNLSTTPPAPLSPEGYERQLSCQIWSLDGRLLARSSGAPEEALSAPAQGFSSRVVNGEDWRVFTITDTEKGVRVMVGDRVGLRDRLVRDLIAGLLAPALLIAPLLALLIWAVLARGFAPLSRMASEIAARDGEDIRPVAVDHAPSEVRPLLGALNSLFAKVEAARQHERDLTAFAAHELRTPLAGLKTQAQIALAAPDAAIRDDALRQILVSVERSARLVRQLLALARLEAAPAQKPSEEAVPVGPALREIVHHSPAAPGIVVEIDPALDDLARKVDREALHLVLRNLHENALQHVTGPGGIRWRRIPHGVCVEDDGPGIPEDELPRVAERFFRGRNKSLSGSGLGLTIATLAAGRMGARLDLANRADGTGLRVRILWPDAHGA